MGSFEGHDKRIQDLHDAMLMILPLENTGEDPFEYFGMNDRIISFLDDMSEEMMRRRISIQSEIDELSLLLKKICSDMELSEPMIPEMMNLSMMKRYMQNEVNRVRLVRTSVETRISIVINDILEMRNEVGDVHDEVDHRNPEDSYKGPTAERLRELERYGDMLREEIQKKEWNRDGLYKELLIFLSQLSMTDDEVRIDQKISVLEGLHEKYKNEVSNRNEEFRRLEKDIRRREDYLDISWKEIEMDLGDENLIHLRRYNEYLEEEQERLLNEIYEKKRDTLRELLDLFGMDVMDYQRNEVEVEEMTRMIGILENKKDLFVSIASLIDKRLDLVEKMNEFEKIASDPRRLFRSSFQLLSEEKFRKNAYPNLMKIEETLFQLLDEYEERFEEFKRDGMNYKESLRKEIENRIVNRTVFINRFDSPVRRKK